MEKIELLKSIVNSQYLEYPLHLDIPNEELKLAFELECDGYLRKVDKDLKPTEKGMKAAKFNSFDDYESSLQQNKSIINNNTINGGFVRVSNENYIDLTKPEQKKEKFFSKFMTWLITLFK